MTVALILAALGVIRLARRLPRELASLTLRHGLAALARPGADLGELAKDAGLISAEECAQWQRKESLRKHVIKVDDFPQDFGRAEILVKLAQAQSKAAPAAKAA